MRVTESSLGKLYSFDTFHAAHDLISLSREEGGDTIKLPSNWYEDERALWDRELRFLERIGLVAVRWEEPPVVRLLDEPTGGRSGRRQG